MEDGLGNLALDRGRFGVDHRNQIAGLVALDPYNGVNQQMHGQGAAHARLLAVEAGAHRIDQERHVVVDDLNNRMGGLPAVILVARIVDPDPRLAGLALVGKAP